MVYPTALQHLLVLLPFYQKFPNYTFVGSSNTNEVTHWNYERQGADWEGTCSTGVHQSPIQLAIQKSVIAPLPRIQFVNYDVKLSGPLVLVNNGHSVHMDVPVTRNGAKPYIAGGILKHRYVAEGFHFHWGSPTSRGSEHVINRRRYDVELHIVHRNERYPNIDEAVLHPDGLAVLGIMLKIEQNPNRIYPGISRVFEAVPKVIDYDSEARLSGSITLGQMLGDLNTRFFYTYKGSLTTPGCEEATTWIVFSQVLPISRALVARLWHLKDEYGDPIRNNYRALQPRNNRYVYYRLNNA